MKPTWRSFFDQALEAADAAGVRRVRGGPARPTPTVDFGSNDYLGLSNHPDLRRAIGDALNDQAWGSGASPVLGGYSHYHRDLEAVLANHCDTEAALIFSSGYACNVGTIASLAGAADAIYSDQLNHASLIDGARLSGAHRVIFPHRDCGFVEQHLRKHRHRFRRVMILTESLFSMDGDCADLSALCHLAEKYDCGVVVDEAHACGIYGNRGGGLLEELALNQPVGNGVLIKLGTLSKAVGGVGGYAAGESAVIEYLVNHCRSYLFSTSPPAAAMAASLAAIELLRGMQVERVQLRATARQLRETLRSAGWNVPAGDSPIVPVIVGSESDTMALCHRLLAAGIHVPAIRPPTVPAGASRLRVSLTARHTLAEVEHLVQALGRSAHP